MKLVSGAVVASLVLLLAGCSHTKYARLEAEKRADQQAFRDHRMLMSVGLEKTYPDYKKSAYAKNGDVAGYIDYYRKKKADEKAAEERAYKAYIPSLQADVRACVLKGGAIDNYRYDPDTCFSQLPDAKKAPLRINGNGVIPDYRKMEVIGPLLKEIKVVHDEKNVREFTEMITKARAREQQRAEAQRAAEKRAYENSIQSLVE